ncbi:chaperone protein dnaJ 11, chloroplastic-like [Magnolia sinica]|uniref:chaperone protein dnaJ 11, chloroplastic-like n=1 Tax=Magnolia sinica TaxID=86752 RepID=UPI00265A5816|nr:chaperone protein dnaJ 11, chloroplastic-like [Magnolia sinica]
MLASPYQSSQAFFRFSTEFRGPRISVPTSPSTVSPRLRPPRVIAAHSSADRQTPPPPAPASSAMASTASLYDVLGLSTGATCQEIKAAYRRLVRLCHPDVVATDRKDRSAEQFMRIHAAYSTLSDPEKRTDYDRKLLLNRPFPSSSSFKASSFSGYGRRTWETDQCW